jgi:hypothetical protein
MEKYLYDNYVVNLSSKFSRALEDISAEYNFDYGDEFEIAICKVLRLFLPIKYGVCRGHVVNSNGQKQGDDIIIYDQERFPTLKINQKDDFSRKENIPIEAVYAYIEAKHKLDFDTFDKAFEQISNVKELILERKKTGTYQLDPYIDDNGLSHNVMSLPKYRNPVFCMILSRHSVNKNGNKTNNINDIYEFLQLKRESIK